MKYNGTVYYYVTNLQGDVVRIVDASGNTVASYEYDPYGKVISATGTLAEVNPIRYRGYYYDNETGLYYLQSRYYDPAVGRFVNADEYASTGQGIIGHNMFAYCNNCPITQSDATGNFAIPLAVVGITVFALAAAFVGLSFVHHTTVTSSSISTNNTISLPKTNTPAVSSSKKKNPAKKPVNLPSWKKLEVDMDHISSGHMPNGSRNPDDKKSVFVGLTTSQVLKAIREAYNHSSKLTSIGDRIKLSGYSDTFGLVIEIWLNIADDVIETAYPKG